MSAARGVGRATILVTGASGVVGRALLPHLDGHRVIAMVHSDGELDGVETVRGNVARPNLGLSPAAYAALESEVDVIVHSAALTEWGQPAERYDAVNVEGARRVAELATAARAPVYFMSTSFVRALEAPARPLAEGNVVRNYVASKLASEQVLAQYGVGLTVFRPTNLVGDSATGWSSRPQIVHAMSEWIAQGRAPFLPVHPGNRIDVVSQDILAIATARAIEAGDVGSVYWVTQGAEAMTAEQAIEVCREHAQALGRAFEAPPIVDPTGRLPVALDDVPASSRAYLRVLMDVSEIVAACGGVLPSSLPQLRARLGVPEVSDVEAYRRTLAYWAGRAVAARAEEER